MFSLLGGAYLGWALGANDASNVFGTAVGAKIIKFRTAAVLCAVAVVVGAALQGGAGIHTLSGLAVQTTTTLVIVSVSAALTVTIMTFLNLPISTWVRRRPELLRGALDRLAEADVIRRPRRASFTNEQAWALLLLDRWMTQSGAI